MGGRAQDTVTCSMGIRAIQSLLPCLAHVVYEDDRGH